MLFKILLNNLLRKRYYQLLSLLLISRPVSIDSPNCNADLIDLMYPDSLVSLKSWIPPLGSGILLY